MPSLLLFTRNHLTVEGVRGKAAAGWAFWRSPGSGSWSKRAGDSGFECLMNAIRGALKLPALAGKALGASAARDGCPARRHVDTGT